MRDENRYTCGLHSPVGKPNSADPTFFLNIWPMFFHVAVAARLNYFRIDYVK